MRVISALFFWACYFAPTIVGYVRKYPSVGRLFFMNLAIGWTVVGWFFMWVLVFPKQFAPLTDRFAAFIQRNAVRSGPAGPIGRPNPADGSGSQQMRTCPQCSNGKMRCPTCQGKGSWYEQPTTAGGSAPLTRCSYCSGSGTVQCTNCAGTGKVW